MGRCRIFGLPQLKTDQPDHMSKVKKETVKSSKEKIKYQVTNWSAYNRALINRGDITIYFTEEAMYNWYDESPAQRGAQYVYSDLCIETLLLFKNVFRLPYRQTQGFAQSIFMLMGLDDLKIPSYSQINRRSETLDLSVLDIPTSGNITVAIDSTGLKIYGEGEWKVRKHGYSKRRTWRKLHLGCDPDTGFIHCATLTKNDVDDASQLEDLLDQLEGDIDEVYLDGAYDKEKCWDGLIDRQITPIIPPRIDAVEWYEHKIGDLHDYPRNVAVRHMREHSLKDWKIKSGYHRRSLSETQMFRMKTIFGNKLYSRLFERQQAEVKIKIRAINIMTAQGMPVSIRVDAA